MASWRLLLILGALETSGGCGSASLAPAPETTVELAWSPEVGASYAISLELLTQEERFRAQERFEVMRVEEDRIVVRSFDRTGELDALASTARLPPRSSHIEGEVELVMDRSGHVLSTSALTLPVGPDPLGVPLLMLLESGAPPQIATVGEAWSFSAEGMWPGQGAATLASATSEQAELSWNISFRGPHAFNGTTTIALSDRLPRRMAIDRSGEGALSHTFLRACVSRHDEEPCVLPDDDERVAVVSYRDQCAPRVEEIADRLGRLAGTWEDVDETGVPAVPTETTTVALEGRTVRATVGPTGLELDGRAVAAPDVSALLAFAREAWTRRRPSAPPLDRVRVVAAASTPLSVLEPLLVQVDMSVEIVVGLGATAPSAPLPAWLGEIPDGPTRRFHLAEAWGQAAMGCPEALWARRPRAGHDMLERPGERAQVVLEAISSCGCGGVDLDAAEVILDHDVRTHDVALGALVLPPVLDGDDVVLSRTSTLGDLVSRLLERPAPDAPLRIRF